MPAKSKVCTKCGKRKKLECFYARPGAKDGKQTSCKECQGAVIVAWRRANPDKVRAHHARYRQMHREARRAYTAAWNAANKDRRRAYEQRPAVVEARRAMNRLYNMLYRSR